MKLFFTLTTTALMLCGCGEQNEQILITAPLSSEGKGSAELTQLRERASATTHSLGGALQAELQSAMIAGGPVAALPVCQTQAPALSSRVSATQGMAVKRVSLKPRNAVMGVPNDWETTVLKDFDTRKANGESPSALVYSKIVEGEFRYMQAIPTQPVCLACHGQLIAPSVTAKLAELYPNDQATGYSEGDLRGAFVVTQKVLQ